MRLFFVSALFCLAIIAFGDRFSAWVVERHPAVREFVLSDAFGAALTVGVACLIWAPAIALAVMLRGNGR